MNDRTILETSRYLHECHGTIHLDTTHVQHPRRENDMAIMHLVNAQTTHKININQKQKINCVRMYLGVTWVSEICTTDGLSFVSGILHGDECQLNYKTTLTTPHQVKPSKHSCFLWRRILKLLTTAPTSQTTTKNRLQQNLGKWKNTHSKSGRWLSYQDDNNKFYARETHEGKE